MTNESEPKPEPIKAQPFMLPPSLNDDSIVLRELRSDASNIKAEWDFPLSMDTGHEKLSAFVYDLARRIETHNMGNSEITEDEQAFLEELMVLIAKAPLSARFAAKLAFDPPVRITGIGPHTLVAKNGETAKCGGPGLCRWCTRGEPELEPVHCYGCGEKVPARIAYSDTPGVDAPPLQPGQFPPRPFHWNDQGGGHTCAADAYTEQERHDP